MATGVGEEQIDAAAVGNQVTVEETPAGVLQFRLAYNALKILEIAIDGALQFGIRPIAAANLVEGVPPLDGVNTANHDAALTCPEAGPDRRRGRRIHGVRDQLHIERRTGLWREGLRRPRCGPFFFP